MVKVLFVCIHNSARSQMAEAFVNRIAKGSVFAQSAGLTPGTLNPRVVQVMSELNIDISQNETKGVQGFIDRGEHFDYVITVCDEASAERCPVFPGKVERIHWGFEDPSGLQGADQEKLARTRIIRDEIHEKVEEWLKGLMEDDE